MQSELGETADEQIRESEWLWLGWGRGEGAIVTKELGSPERGESAVILPSLLGSLCLSVRRNERNCGVGEGKEERIRMASTLLKKGLHLIFSIIAQ